MLEIIPLENSTNIKIETKELMFIAPSGQPARGSLTIEGEMLDWTIDTVSLKKYLTSLRSEYMLQEEVPSKIQKDICTAAIKQLSNINDHDVLNTIDYVLSEMEIKFSVTVKMSARGGFNGTYSV